MRPSPSDPLATIVQIVAAQRVPVLPYTVSRRAAEQGLRLSERRVANLATLLVASGHLQFHLAHPDGRCRLAPTRETDKMVHGLADPGTR